MPIPTRAGQPAQLDPEDDPDVVEADLGQEPLEAGPPLDGPAAVALVLVDDDHAVRRPAECRGATAEFVLEASRLAVLVHLLGTGLADVNDPQPPQVPGLDLALPPRPEAHPAVPPPPRP